jgi:hypothetical protein
MPDNQEHLWKGEELAVYEYLECGALGHTWNFVDSDHWDASFGEKVTRRCMQCSAERRQQVMRDSRTVLADRYVYPPRFKFARGERPARLDFMLMATDSKRRRRITRPTSITTTTPTRAARAEVAAMRRNTKNGTTPTGNDVGTEASP